ncbi:MAG: DnaA/Hda family protein [SAR324 cluster bacterium]|nr:DnaA/Hda family protein [SAR324 cluster bacterium]
MSAQANQAWLNSLQLLKITPSKVILGGIAHKVYRYEIKTNHETLLKKVLDELYPEKAPFSEKKFEYKIGGISKPKRVIQPEFELNEDPHTEMVEETLPKKIKSSKQLKNTIGAHNTCLLDSFIPGKRNLLASRACRAVVDMPGVAFNPFIIYGESGAGKSHLLEGINHELQQLQPGKQTVQVAAEDFLNDFIVHLRMNKMKEFRDRYRKVDAFLLDDLQALLPSAKCQTELLHTINALRKKKAQIVIACIQAPTQIEGLISGLRGRLESGLTVDIGIPDDQTRIAILESKAVERGIPLSTELAHFIVQHIKGGIGRMEGVLMRLGVHASLLNEELTIDLARYALKDWLDESTKNSNSAQSNSGVFADETANKILQRIYVMFQITEEGLLSYRRDRKHNKARQATVFLLKQLTSLSLSEIGKIVGRNHSTIHATLKKVGERMSSDDFFLKQMQTFLHEFEEKHDSAKLPEEKRGYRF